MSRSAQETTSDRNKIKRTVTLQRGDEGLSELVNHSMEIRSIDHSLKVLGSVAPAVGLNFEYLDRYILPPLRCVITRHVGRDHSSLVHRAITSKLFGSLQSSSAKRSKLLLSPQIRERHGDAIEISLGRG